MKVILTADVKTQGKKGDVIEVSDGYARNFLFRNNLAIEGTASNINSITISKKAIDHHKQIERGEALLLTKKINDTTVTVTVKVGGNGKLFGALNTQNIADALAKSGIEIDKKKIVLSEPIKTIGLHEVIVKTYAEMSAKLKVQVIAITI